MKYKNTDNQPLSNIMFWGCLMALVAVYLYWPALAQAAISFGDIGNNVADSAKGIAKGITLSGYAGGVGMGVWGVVEMVKASKGGGSHTYGGGMIKIIMGALVLGLGEFLGSGSATLFGSDQTTGLDELGLR